MKKALIDEYLSIPLRQRIDKLVELNLDLESILSLLSNDLYEFSPEMLEETKRYVKYVIWLRNQHKDRSLAFEKYKKQVKQKEKNDSAIRKNSQKEKQSHLTNELFLAQLQKERKRIDEISSLHYEKASIQNQQTNQTNLDQEINPVDEILESLTDEEIQETLSEILTQNVGLNSSEFNETNFDQNQEKNQTEEFEEKKKTKHQQPILDEPTGDQNPKTLIPPTKKIADLTFEDILTDHSTTLLTPETSQTLFDFDYLEDNGTETLNDSILLEDEELNLQSFTTNQTLKAETEKQKSNPEETEPVFEEIEIESGEVSVSEQKSETKDSEDLVDEFVEIEERQEKLATLNNWEDPLDPDVINNDQNLEDENSEIASEMKTEPVFEEIEIEFDQNSEAIATEKDNPTEENKNPELLLDEKSEVEHEELEVEFEIEEEWDVLYDESEDSIDFESEEFEDASETDQALDFLDQLEDKYGDQTLITLNAEKHDLQTTNFTLADPTSTLKIGVHVHYQNHDYVVENIEIELDFFHHQQTILTLVDIENQESIRINAKKVK